MCGQIVLQLHLRRRCAAEIAEVWRGGERVVSFPKRLAARTSKSRVAVGQITIPDPRHSLTERTLPSLAMHREGRLLGCWRGQINCGNVNLIVSRRAITLPAIHDPFRHVFYRPRRNLNQRLCTASFHRSRRIDGCRQFRRSLLREFLMLHSFAAALRTCWLDARPLCR